MAATKEDVQGWVQHAKDNNFRYVISVCDTFDYEDYPVYCKDKEELEEKVIKYDGVNMQKINEVIKVGDDYEKVGENMRENVREPTIPNPRPRHPELLKGEIFIINVKVGENWFSSNLPKFLKSVRKGEQAYTSDGRKLPKDKWKPLFGTLTDDYFNR